MHSVPSTCARIVGVAILLAVAAVPLGAQSSEPSRHELLRRARADKVATLHAYQPGRLEGWLSRLENEQTIENLFDVPSPSAGGYYLTLGDITAGAGLTLGTGYNVRSWWGDRMSLAVRAAGGASRSRLRGQRRCCPKLHRRPTAPPFANSAEARAGVGRPGPMSQSQ
jgi:hypothetical protein